MKKLLKLLSALALALALSACGSKDNGDSKTASAPATEELVIHATADGFKFNKAEYRVKKDTTYKVTLTNDNGTHGIRVKGMSLSLGGGESKDYTFAKAGDYEIQCTVQCGTGHLNMKSKLIVE